MSDSHPWQRAAAFAARAHAHQRRRDGQTPYFSHCARVAIVVTSVFGCDDELAITAAFLHDTIEDTATDYDDIERNFGRGVADCVAALTKNMILPEPAREKDYAKRLKAADWRARLIKLADSYDNLLDAEGTQKITKATRTCRKSLAIASSGRSPNATLKRAISIVKKTIRDRE